MSVKTTLFERRSFLLSRQQQRAQRIVRNALHITRDSIEGVVCSDTRCFSIRGDRCKCAVVSGKRARRERHDPP